MRKHWSVFALVAVLGLAAWGTSASALTSPKVFSLLDAAPQTDQPMGSFTFDRVPAGGDQFAFDHTLYKWAGTKKGARVGHLQVIGTFVTGFGAQFSQPALVLIDAQAYLPGGTVVVVGYGRLNPNGPSKLTLPVVGGTGIYDNVHGHVEVRDLGNGSIGKTNIEFHLLP